MTTADIATVCPADAVAGALIVNRVEPASGPDDTGALPQSTTMLCGAASEGPDRGEDTSRDVPQAASIAAANTTTAPVPPRPSMSTPPFESTTIWTSIGDANFSAASAQLRASSAADSQQTLARA
jgi:hypothetical protein